MSDLENRFKGFINEGEKKADEAGWKLQDDKVKPKKEKRSSKNYHPIIFMGIMTLITVGILGGGYMYLNQVPQNKSNEANLAQPTTEQTPSPAPSATSVPRDQVKILVLNGTGIKGQAGKVQTSLEGLGYKLIDVETAEDEVETTTIEYKPGAITAEDLAEIKTLLEKTYLKVIELKYSEAKEDLKMSKFFLRITTGSLKKSS